MKTLIVIGIIVLALFLIGLIRVGAEAAYDDRGFRLAIRFGPFRIALGRKQKTARKIKEKEDLNAEEGAEKKKKKRPSLSLIFSIAQRAFAILGRLVRNLHVDVLKLHFTSAYDDPAVTALAYGAAGTMMEALGRIGGSNIVCSDMHADVDFDSREPRYDFRVAARIPVGRILGAASRFAFGVLFDYLLDKRKEHFHG